MSYAINDIDHQTLATELLALAKKHMRVLSTTDDDYIKGLITRTIDVFERQSGLTVFATMATWEPDGFDVVTANGVLLPLQPVAKWTATDRQGNDVTGNYKLVGQATGRAGGLYLKPVNGGSTVTGITVELVVGVDAADDIPPAALQAILDRIASLYAWREDLTDATASDLPISDNIWLTGNWVPRA